MAEVVPIQGTSYEGKVRNVLAPVGLSIITLGIYGFVWYYKTNKELAEIGRAHDTEELGTSPGTSVLAVTLGAIIIVPALVSYWNWWHRQQKAAVLLGREEIAFSPVGGFFITLILWIVGAPIFQSVQNKIIEAQAQVPAGSAAAAIPAAPAAEAAPAADAAETVTEDADPTA